MQTTKASTGLVVIKIAEEPKRAECSMREPRKKHSGRRRSEATKWISATGKLAFAVGDRAGWGAVSVCDDLRGFIGNDGFRWFFGAIGFACGA
jgi:hypothetical protein